VFGWFDRECQTKKNDGGHYGKTNSPLYAESGDFGKEYVDGGGDRGLEYEKKMDQPTATAAHSQNPKCSKSQIS